MSKDLKQKTNTDLEKALKEKRQGLLDFRFNMSGSGKRSSKEAKTLRREISQILTELGSREK